MQINNDVVHFTGPMESAPVWGGLHVRQRIQRSAIHLSDVEAFIEEDVGDDGFIERFVCSFGGQAYPIGEQDYYNLIEYWSEWRNSVV